MPPHLTRTAKRYLDAMAYAPSPGYPSRMPTRVMGRRNYAGPLPSPSVSGLGDGDGLGGILDFFTGAVSTVTAPVTDKIDRLEGAIKMILLLSGVAALTGVINIVRR